MRFSVNTLTLFARVSSIALGATVACGDPTLDANQPRVSARRGDAGSAPTSNTNLCNGTDCSSPAAAPIDEVSCAVEAQALYVVANTQTSLNSYGPPVELWRFWPPTFEFEKVGTPPCMKDEAAAGMSVDRNGTAWIVGYSGKVYPVSTKDASCTSEPTLPLLIEDALPEIAFVGKTNSELYAMTAHNSEPAELGKIDRASGKSQPIGKPKGTENTHGPITADGNGSLFYLDAESLTNRLFEIDPASANVLNIYDTAKNTITGSQGETALAYFGTQFYIFKNVEVYRFDPATKATTHLGNTPWNSIHMAGAGQSTCVPNAAVAPGTPSPIK